MKRVLVIDDNDFIRDELKESMQECFNSHVMLADSSSMGIRTLKEKEFDLVICDLEMPGGSGLEVWNYIREKY